MNIDRYKEVESLFVEVVDLLPGHRRDAICRQTDDDQLVELVQLLLDEHDRLMSDGFLDSVVIELPNGLAEAECEDPCPATIGGYSIERVLGRGGSGTVYLAASPLPLERTVALKLIHLGMGELTLTRFREEQRLLAQLKHPGIAEVYDEGATENGRLFTVLEYIDGEPITDYCRSHDLPWRSIVGLMIQCCEAVAHAHQCNIIHRDLKPSNVLVTGSAARARVKVIDFGTAKFLDPLIEASRLTLTFQFVGTLPYSSPEQVSGVATPDTRTDVYCLGILFYECLEGTHPYTASKGGLKTMIDSIISESIPELVPRNDMPTRELNAILSHACRKEPVERYSSLIHFSEDLQSLLDGTPVRVMSAKRGYLAKKIVSRYRYPIGAATMFVLLLAVVTVIAMAQSARATKHRNALRETAIRMVDDLMPMLADLSGTAEARRELASSLHQRVGELLAADPNDHELLFRVAKILEYESDMALSNGFAQESESLRLRASEIVARLQLAGTGIDADLPATQRQLNIKLGDIAKDRHDFAAAWKFYSLAHESLLASTGELRVALCWSYERLGWTATRLERREEAMRFSIERLSLSLQLLEEHPESPLYLRNCSSAHVIMAEKILGRNQFDLSYQHAACADELAQRLVALEPSSYFSQLTELHAAVALTRSSFFNGLVDESNEQSDRVILLVNRFVETNPNRKDVREIAWSKLYIINEVYWGNTRLQKSRRSVENAMRELFPGRSTQ